MRSTYEDSLTAVVGLNLPNSWIQTSLGTVTKIASGGTPSTKRIDYFNGSVPWITPADLSVTKSKYISKGARNISETGLKNSSAVLLPKGTVVFSSRAPIGYVAIAANELATNQGCKNFLPSDYIFNEYLYYFLKASKPLAERYASGTTFLELSAKNAAKIPIPVPPIAEQHRIAAKIEELFTRLDAGAQYLRATTVQLKNYRKSVLKYAFEGKFTKLWREGHKNEITPATEFLKHIGGNKSESAKQARASYPDLNNVCELPESWMWVQIGRISDLSAGNAFKKSEYANQGVRLLQISNVSFGSIIWNKVAYLPDSYLQKYPNLALRTGDIVMALNRPVLGNELKIGKLNEKDTPAILYQRVGRLDFFDARIGPYLYYYAQSRQFVRDLKASLQGVDQPFINKPRLLNIALPLAPLEEQPHIVEGIERRLSVIDTVKQQIEQNTQYVETVRRAILKMAFTGRLVAQDPGEELASEVLERIADIQSRTRITGRSHRIQKSYQTELRQNGG